MVCEQVEITEYSNVSSCTWKYILSAARGGSWRWQVGVGMGRNCPAASSARELGKICMGGWDHCCFCSGQSLWPHSHVNNSSKPGFLWPTCRLSCKGASDWLLPPSVGCFSPEEVPCRPLLRKEQSPCGGNMSELCCKRQGVLGWGRKRVGWQGDLVFHPNLNFS